MTVLILNGSPKKKNSASGLLGRLTGLLLAGCRVRYASLGAKGERPRLLAQLKEIDALILAAPLYVDGIPSHVLEFLQEAEQYCLENGCRFSVYAISNNGFIEGIHNRSCLKMYQCWCRRAGLAWGGGIGVGGGEMFRCLALWYPAVLALLAAKNLAGRAMGAEISASAWMPLVKNAGIYLLLNGGVFYCILRLAAGVRRLRPAGTRYTRVMVPAFLFIPMADIFMVLEALLNGRFIFTLLKKDRCIPNPGPEQPGGGRKKEEPHVFSQGEHP